MILTTIIWTYLVFGLFTRKIDIIQSKQQVTNIYIYKTITKKFLQDIYTAMWILKWKEKSFYGIQ